ncbi:MAG TPA: DUF4291 family protein [Pseudonocardiaceae bacterium]|nr:DUF4291 family protein [Pseudonocardiaceae bacterium]
MSISRVTRWDAEHVSAARSGTSPTSPTVPFRQIRAEHTDRTITVYQAYPPVIADAALAAGTFVAPFRRERMTWIKPSFRWMAYRCGWATKPGQERVLAVRLSRAGFEKALTHSCLSHPDRGPSPTRPTGRGGCASPRFGCSGTPNGACDTNRWTTGRSRSA